MANIKQTDQNIATQAGLQGSKTWRPIRPVAVISSTDDRLQHLQSEIKATNVQVALNSVAVDTAPSAPGNGPGQVTGVSASVIPQTVNGSLKAIVAVSFTPGSNFSTAQVWFTGYGGSNQPQLMTSGFSSPIEFITELTGELVVVTVVAVNSGGVAASFATAPTTAAVLNSTGTAPPAPSISQSLVAMAGSAGWQFTFNTISGLLSAVIASYRIYRGTTSTTPTAGSSPFASIPQPPASTAQYTYQDTSAGATVYYYWVSAVSTTGLESTLTAANATTLTTKLYPTASTGSFSNPSFAYDGSDTTSSDLSLSTSVSSPLTGTEVWSAWAAFTGFTIDSISVDVLSYAGISGVGESWVQYSKDSGATWTSLYNCNSTAPSGGGSAGSNSTPKQYYSATIPTTQDLTLFQVRAISNASDNTYISGHQNAPGYPPIYSTQHATVVQNVYEARLTVTYH